MAKILDIVTIGEPDLEQSVLGTCLLESGAAEGVFYIIAPEDFSTDSHRLIAAAVKDLTYEGSGCDLVSTTNYLRRNGQLDRVGGAALVSSLLDNVPDVANHIYHANLIKQAANRRRLADVTARSRNRCTDTTMSVDDIAAELIAQTVEIIGDGIGRASGLVSLAPVVDKYIQRSFQVRDRKRTQSRVETGINQLDRRLSIEPGSLTVIAGGTGSGKTALALQVALHAAANTGTVAFFSLEVGRSQLAGRALAAKLPKYLGLSSFNLAGGAYPTKSKDEIRTAADVIRTLPIFVDDKPGTTSSEMRMSLRRLASSETVSLVIVDYLQLIRSRERGRSREREVAQISADLLMIAREIDVPVIALSQLSRAHQHERREPRLHDLRESGSLEQDAHNVILIGYPESKDNQERSLYVAKQRGGETFTVKVVFEPKSGTFFASDRIHSE